MAARARSTSACGGRGVREGNQLAAVGCRALATCSRIWLAGCAECLAHGLGIAGNHGEVSTRRLIGHSAALFPIAQRADRNLIPPCKLVLTEPQRTPDDLHLRRTLHPSEILGR